MTSCCSMPAQLARVVSIVTLSSLMHAQTPVAKLIPANPVALRVQPGLPLQDANVDIGLHIVVLQGQSGVNIIKKRAAVRPVVEVRDRTNMPVAGASVTFTAPNEGPSAVFLNGSHSETLVTDLTGQATVSSMKPVSTGTFKLAVSASFQGEIATASISQTNVLTSAEAAAAGEHGTPVSTSNGLSTRAVVGIVAGVAAAAAVGIGVGLASGKNSSSASSLGPGAPTVGAPH